MSEDDDLWPVVPSEIVADTLADPSVSAEVFSTVATLTVAIREDPGLAGSEQVGADLEVSCASETQVMTATEASRSFATVLDEAERGRRL
ncbi:hypothetical protein ACIBO5_02200 [Nonomuraea angiospora]|uniref:hypothetical protein n=1 Tax=Nonomuraea angiospora TaxID=46172 RepID=UPI003793590E